MNSSLSASLLSNSNFKLGPSCTIFGTQSQVELVSTNCETFQEKSHTALVALAMTQSILDTVDKLMVNGFIS